MGLVERVGDLARVAKGLLETKRSFLQPLRERLAFEVLHDDEIDPVVAPNVVEPANLG